MGEDFLPLTAERWSDFEKLFGKSGGTGGCCANGQAMRVGKAAATVPAASRRRRLSFVMAASLAPNC